MLQIRSYSVGPLSTNCYFVTHTPSGHTIIIDPGGDGDFLSEEITHHHLLPVLIYFTHGHFDHVCGALPLYLNFHPQVFLHPADIRLYRQAPSAAKFFTHLTPDPIIPLQQLLIDPHQCLSLIRSSFSLPPTPSTSRIINVPGHSPGLTALFLQLEPNQPLLFSGDFIFAAGTTGRTDFPYSDPAAMTASLRCLTTLLPTTQVYPGHETTPFTLSDFSL